MRLIPFVAILLFQPLAIAQDMDLLEQINSVRKIYEKVPLVTDDVLNKLAAKEIANKDFCVSNTTSRLAKSGLVKETAWVCDIVTAKDTFQYWLDRSEFVLATSRRDIKHIGIARWEDNWLILSK